MCRYHGRTFVISFEAWCSNDHRIGKQNCCLPKPLGYRQEFVCVCVCECVRACVLWCFLEWSHSTMKSVTACSTRQLFTRNLYRAPPLLGVVWLSEDPERIVGIAAGSITDTVSLNTATVHNRTLKAIFMESERRYCASLCYLPAAVSAK
jgi:hypothetical protein